MPRQWPDGEPLPGLFLFRSTSPMHSDDFRRLLKVKSVFWDTFPATMTVVTIIASHFLKKHRNQVDFSLKIGYNHPAQGGLDMNESLIYLDTYLLQQDMRVRLPKAILTNMAVEKGSTKFDIFFNAKDQTLVLKIHDKETED